MATYSTDADMLALAQVEFNGRIREVGEAPGTTSGVFVVYQDGSAEVTELRAGSGLQVGDVVQLGVPLVATSRWVARQPDGRFGLDLSAFRPDASFHAWARWENDRWAALTVDI